MRIIHVCKVDTAKHMCKRRGRNRQSIVRHGKAGPKYVPREESGLGGHVR